MTGPLDYDDIIGNPDSRDLSDGRGMGNAVGDEGLRKEQIDTDNDQIGRRDR